MNQALEDHTLAMLQLKNKLDATIDKLQTAVKMSKHTFQDLSRKFAEKPNLR